MRNQFPYRLFFCLFLLLPTLARAQDATATPAPWPPDPRQLFAPGVEIVSTEIYPREEPPSSRPWDDKKRVVYVDDSSGTSKAFSYPEQVVSAAWPDKLDEQTVFVSVVEQIPGSTQTRPWLWILNPITGVWTPYQAHCGQQSLYKSDEITQNWIFYESKEDGNTYLCETATGKMSSPLPANIDWYMGYNGSGYRAISISPDKKWLVFFGSVPNDPNYYLMYAYSYEVASGKLNRLGGFAAFDNLQFERWVGTQVLIDTSEMPEFSTRAVYIADVTHPDNLELAVSRVRFDPVFQENPPRYDYVDGTEGSLDAKKLECKWIIYTISDRKQREYDMGTLCEPVIGKLGEIAYYRDLPFTNSPVASLVRFNPITGERKDLFTGEIESIEWVSPDEHYAILTLDTSGRVDTIPYIDIVGYWPDMPNARLSYVDLQSKRVLFDIPAVWELDTWEYGAGPTASLRPQSDGSVLAVVPEQGCCTAGYVSRFELKNGVFIEKRLLENLVTYVGEHYLVWADGRDVSNAINQVNLQTGKQIPIIKSFNDSAYRTAFAPLQPDSIRVTLIPREVISRFARSVTYTIRLPSGN
jgi:hypothetical protein